MSATTRGFLLSTRMAAFIALRSFEVDEFVIAGITEVRVEPDPFGGVEKRFARERPALQIELLELAAVAFEHDVALLADALDFGQRRLQLEQPQVVKAAERNHQVELVVAERISILRAVLEELVLHVRVGVGEAMIRDVEARDLEARLDLQHLVEQKALAATDVEHLR